MADLGSLARESAAVLIGNPDQPLRLTERQRAQQQRVDHAEYRGARANTKPDNEYREGGESPVPAQGPKRVAQVLQNAVQCGHTTGMGHGFLLVYILKYAGLVTRVRNFRTDSFPFGRCRALRRRRSTARPRHKPPAARRRFVAECSPSTASRARD